MSEDASKHRAIEFTPKTFNQVAKFAENTNRSFKAAAKTLIEEALNARNDKANSK